MVETKGAVDEDIGNPAVRLCEVLHHAGSCGFNLSKSKWDPYPWVSTVDAGSPASTAGVLPGDCVVEVNGEDILGLRVAEVAARVRSRGDRATLMLWNPGVDSNCTSETLCCGPMPTNLQRLTTCLSSILASLECPICLDTIPPPAHQCANGHLICLNCRVRTDRCPVCRLRFFRGRSLLADQVFDSLIDAFDLKQEDESARPNLLRQRVYGPKKKDKKTKPEIKVNLLSPTNKFLTRIMGSGKSSSVENLSIRQHESGMQIAEDFTQGLKAKSLSSSEICQIESQPLSGASSVLSSRPGSGLLDVRNIHLGTRPASYHGSADDLHSRMFEDFGIEITVPTGDACICPMVPFCKQIVAAQTLQQHLKCEHEGPIITISSSRITAPLSWFTRSNSVLLECYGTTFFANVSSTGRFWVWSSTKNANNFFASLKTEKEKVEFSIRSLCHLDLEQIINYGIPLMDINESEEIELVIGKNG